MKGFKFKQAIVVRKDLRMGKGKIAAQSSHAAVSTCEIAREKFKDWYDSWLKNGQCKVVLKANSEGELLKLKDKAEKLGLPTTLIRDRGLTQVSPGTITCLGIGPGPSELVDKVTGKLPLL
ncbi:MAG: peptidyl-tRNA hydrolase Pth2 [Candidatus Bathyarchaeia archaeon]